MNRKFFQMRQMTKNLDSTFDKDMARLQSFLEDAHNVGDCEFLEETDQLSRWEEYKKSNIKELILSTSQSDQPFKICLCGFLSQFKCKLSLEIWFKVMFDIFHDEFDGRVLRYKFWTYMKQKAYVLQSDLQQRIWPRDWNYLEKESCLNLEILKLFEHYMPVRIFLARHLNQSMALSVDLRKMPMLVEDKSVFMNFHTNTWFPKLCVNNPKILEQLYQSNNIFCHQILNYSFTMYEVMKPILDAFQNKEVPVVNVYGENCEFMFEVLYSLKSSCGVAIRHTEGCLRIKKEYKGLHTQEKNEELCKVLISVIQKSDLNSHILNDLHANQTKGFNLFVQEDQRNRLADCQQRLVIILSVEKLKIKNVQNIRMNDLVIDQLMSTLDYKFLIYYANILFNKPMIVQQNSGSRKPFYQLMICMWTYILPVYFQNKDPSFMNHPIFEIMANFSKEPMIYLEEEPILIDDDEDQDKLQQSNEETLKQESIKKQEFETTEHKEYDDEEIPVRKQIKSSID